MALRFSRSRTNSTPRMPLLKKLIWLYFLLLIFEGALRKWMFTEYSGPLLLVRDPVALLIILEALRTRRWPREWTPVVGILSAAMLALCFVQLIAGQNPWFVAIYGLRSYLLPFPVAFIMGATLDEEDLRNFGNVTLWLLLPLTALEVAQYFAPPGSFLNAGAFEGTKQLDYAAGHVRASATFSYVTGPANFIPMAATFIFYGIANDRFASKGLLWAAAFALVFAVPVTGSRMVLLLLMALLACVATAAMFGVSQLAASLKVILALLVVAMAVSRLPVFSEATATFQQRLIEASGSEGGTQGTLESRLINPIAETIEAGLSPDRWYGSGMGIGSNVASKLLTGTQQFLAGEGEFSRVVTEFGGIFGLAFMLFRFLLATLIAAKALSRVRDHQTLAWFFVPLMVNGLVFDTLEVPTLQGFMVVSLAFSLAALNRTGVPDEASPVLNPALRRPGFNLRG